VLHDKLTFHW